MQDIKKVRYITVSRVAFELVATMPDAEIAVFVRTMLKCFKQLENGENIQYEKPENQALGIILEESMSELKNGYETYMQRVNANKSAKRRCITDNIADNITDTITDQSATNQRPTIEENRKDIEEKNNRNNRENAELFKQMNQDGFNMDVSSIVTVSRFINEYGKDAVLEAVKRCKERSVYTLAYMRKILENMAKKPNRQDDDDGLNKYIGWA